MRRMQDVTSLLDPRYAEERNLPYLSLEKHVNSIGWAEMRTFLYIKGLFIFGRQGIFVCALVMMEILCSLYLMYRILSDASLDSSAATDTKTSSDILYRSETYNGLLFAFLVLMFSLLRMLTYPRSLERLQNEQISLLGHQVSFPSFFFVFFPFHFLSFQKQSNLISFTKPPTPKWVKKEKIAMKIWQRQAAQLSGPKEVLPWKGIP